MKRGLHLLLPLMAVLALSACIREEAFTGNAPRMTIRASVPEDPFTKAGFTVPESGTGLHLTWMEGDCIRVINKDAASSNAQFDIQPGFKDHVAQFEGPEVSGSYFNIIAPGTYASVEEAEASNPDLTQDGNGSTDHLVFTAMLENVAKADLADIGFTPKWVEDHPGTALKRGGIVKLILTLPEAVKAPRKVTMTGIGNPVSVNIKNVDLSSEHVLTVYAQSGWDDVEIPAWTEFTIWVIDEDGTTWAATNTIKTAATLKAGVQNILKVDGTFTEQLFAGGDGTQENPWLIANAKHLDNMHVDGVLKHQEKVYFRLIEDIDMADYLASNRWIPLNWESPYDRLIHFDGDNHTITGFTCSYNNNVDGSSFNKPSFFGLLYGECLNVTFQDAVITCNSGTSGVLGGYIGYTAKKAVVSNVHIKGGSITRSGSTGDSGTGAFAGRAVCAYFYSCSSTMSVTAESASYVGGFVGVDRNESVHFRNCYFGGSVRGSQRVGGIIGGLTITESSVVNCLSEGEVSASRCHGSIAGHCNLDNGTVGAYDTTRPDNLVQGCLAWQSSLKTRTQDQPGSNFWSSGAILGYTARYTTLASCYRRSDMDFVDWANVFTLYDQADATPSTPLAVTNPNATAYTYYSPYHGKSYSGTASAAASSIGWSTVAWDLSGDTPVLTGELEELPEGETPTSGAADVVPSSGNVWSGKTYADYISELRAQGPIRPEDGDENGKWSVEEIETGITYYHFKGETTYSGNADNTCDGTYQEFYAVELDLENPDWEVKIVGVSPSTTCSSVFFDTGAVAAINAAYERGSIALKVNMMDNDGSVISYPSGNPLSYMPNNTINSDPYTVVNWKNDATFYCDGHQGLSIAYDGYGKSIKQQRMFYQQCTDDKAGFISSSPILINDYDPIGRHWRNDHNDTSWGSKNAAEHPYVHQGGKYPRTAVALTADNHLLLVACDGRYSAGTNWGEGMSALWLTRFLERYFNPQYALNLDGGGSTTMCVQGKGDMDTNVVNYPWDNNDNGTVHDHAGERSVNSFICIVPADM